MKPRSSDRILVATLLLGFGSAGVAGEIYKCTGANGETVFTNVQCAKPETAKHYGSYQPTPDAPNPEFTPEAIAARQAERAQREADAAIEREIRLTRQAIEQERQDAALRAMGVSGMGIGAQIQDSNRRMREQEAREAAAAAMPRERHRPRHVAAEPPQPPPSIESCRGNSLTGAVTCHRTDGTVLFGHRNPAGSATVQGAGGATEYLKRGANGELKASNGACVRDIYGNCM